MKLEDFIIVEEKDAGQEEDFIEILKELLHFNCGTMDSISQAA